jgi:hypothetical protein
MENIYNLVNQTLAGGIHKIAPPLSRSVRHGESVDANPKGSPSEGAPLLAGFARSGITNPQGAPSLSIPILARQGGEVDLSSESESPKVAPSLSRSVRQGGGFNFEVLISRFRGILLCEAVGLRDCSDGHRVVDVEASRLESFPVEFEQGRILDLRFEDFHRGG